MHEACDAELDDGCPFNWCVLTIARAQLKWCCLVLGGVPSLLLVDCWSLSILCRVAWDAW